MKPFKQFRQLISDYNSDDDFECDEHNHSDNYVPFLPGTRISKEDKYPSPHYAKIAKIKVYIIRKPLFD